MGVSRPLDVRIAEKEERLKILEEDAKKLQEELKQLNNRKREEDRKARTHRLVEIGGAVESALGFQIEKELLPMFIHYLKEQEERGHYVSKALGVYRNIVSQSEGTAAVESSFDVAEGGDSDDLL